jgi:hypothetical protein
MPGMNGIQSLTIEINGSFKFWFRMPVEIRVRVVPTGRHAIADGGAKRGLR